VTIVGGCDDAAHATTQSSESTAVGRVERGMQAIGVYNPGRVKAGIVTVA
jgi:hypothetical protein